jgi:hypothetical protein
MAVPVYIYDRNTFENEKVKGWEMYRIFKASDSESLSDNGGYFVNSQTKIIDKFINIYASNYKGTNLLNTGNYEDFDSLRITANGLFNPFLDSLKFEFNIYGTGNDLIGSIPTNYNNFFTGLNSINQLLEWSIDIEATFFREPSTNMSLVLNGNFTIIDASNFIPRIIPFNGTITNIAPSQVFVDLIPIINEGSSIIVKQINIDFIE